MSCKDVTTQEELDAALAAGECPHLRGSGCFVVSGSAQVTAYGSAQVTAYGSAQVTATGSAQVTAYDSAQVTAYGSAQVTATAWVVTTLHGKRAKAIGGHVVAVPEIKTVADWVEFYGVETATIKRRRVAYVFKAVGDDWKSGHGTSYEPGATPEAADWDGGKDRCGGGLHFSPRPFMALSYSPEATRFVRCPVPLSEAAVITDGNGGADKVKARRVIAPGCQEVDIDGEVVA